MSRGGKHTYVFEVFTRGTWGGVTPCDRCGAEHDHDKCMAYLREQALHWHNADYLQGAPTRIIDRATGSLLK